MNEAASQHPRGTQSIRRLRAIRIVSTRFDVMHQMRARYECTGCVRMKNGVPGDTCPIRRLAVLRVSR
jgi:hypothetical protein